jgi:hypothetical protein
MLPTPEAMPEELDRGERSSSKKDFDQRCKRRVRFEARHDDAFIYGLRQRQVSRGNESCQPEIHILMIVGKSSPWDRPRLPPECNVAPVTETLKFVSPEATTVAKWLCNGW